MQSDKSPEKPEIIIRQHRHWTRCLKEGRRIWGEGNLVLTDQRLLFLHRIEGSPEISAAIKKLADAPIKTVLDHALTLHKHCFEIPLSSVTRVEVGAFVRFPFPYFHLKVSYREGKKQAPRQVRFQFRREKSEIMLHPQLFEDISWMRAVRRAMRENA